jgi:hypothetical protein
MIIKNFALFTISNLIKKNAIIKIKQRNRCQNHKNYFLRGLKYLIIPIYEGGNFEALYSFLLENSQYNKLKDNIV